MAFGSQLAVELEDGESVNTRIIREKISSLKWVFMSKHFIEVEELLVSMVEKLEHEVKSLKKEKELIEERAQIQRLEKSKAESELRECRRECSRLKKERDGFNETVKNISEDRRIMRELKEENLKGEKLKAETEIDFYKRKFEDLEMMFLVSKKDVMLKSDGATSNVGVPGEVVGEKGVVNEKVKSSETAVSVNTKMVATGCNGNVVVEADGIPSCHSPKNGNGDVGATGFWCAGVSGDGLGEGGVSENEKGGSGGIDNLKAKMGVVDSHGNMVLRANGGSSSHSLENGDANVGGASGAGTSQLKEIIAIVDGDNDSLSGKEMAMKGCQDEADLDQEVVENETKLLKRKRASSSNSKDGDGGSNEHKATKRKWLIEGPYGLPVDHCSATNMSSGSNEGRNVYTLSRQGPASAQLEEKITAEHYSQNQRNKVVLDWLLFDTDSEESSSSTDFDFSLDFSAMTKL